VTSIITGTAVVQVANFEALPVTGNSASLYLALDTGQTYVWNGSSYVATGLYNAILQGITTLQGASILTNVAVSGGAVNFAAAKNTLTLTGNVTLTFTGSPSTDQTTILYIVGDSVPRTVTLPGSVWSVAQQTTLASFSVPASWREPSS
jgi:hypothetical protein